jgi:hypothetical protein
MQKKPETPRRMSRLWRDPVSSQIIAAGIIALLGFIWAHFDWGSVGTAVPLTCRDCSAYRYRIYHFISIVESFRNVET